MITAVALLALLGGGSATGIRLEERCRIAEAIVQARGVQAADMKVLRLRLIDEAWIDARTRREGRTVVRGVVHQRGPAATEIPLFSNGETCPLPAILLEHEESPPVNVGPDGNHDLVIEIHLWPRGHGAFRFTERLGSSKHARCPVASGADCLMGVPPARFEGIIGKEDREDKEKKDGAWTPRVTKSTFAS